MFWDLQTNTSGFLDISFEEENNARSIVINAILKYLRIDFDANQGERILDKGGFIGDAILNTSEIAGSLLWIFKRENNADNFRIKLQYEITKVLQRLVNQKLIISFDIKNITIIDKTAYIYLFINNSLDIPLIF